MRQGNPGGSRATLRGDHQGWTNLEIPKCEAPLNQNAGYERVRRGRRPCSREFSLCCCHYFVVQIVADFRHDDAHAPASPVPSVSTEANCVLACCAGLSEDRELLDPIEDRKTGNASGRAERPCWSNTKLARRHTGLDA